MNDSSTIIDVWAPWCRPCRAMEPVVDRAAVHYGGRVGVEKINADENPGRVRELKVRAVPTLISLRGDREIARLTGAQTEDAINHLFALSVGEAAAARPRLSATDRTIRFTAAGALMAVGLMSGPAVPLLVAGAVIGATAIPGARRRARG